MEHEKSHVPITESSGNFRQNTSGIQSFIQAMSRRTILTTIIVPALLISGLIIVLINNPRESPAELVLAQQQIHFGTLPEWEGSVTQPLTARNIGRDTLHIQRIHTGCSYAEITGPDVIQPDGEGAFQIVLNPELLPTDETSATVAIFTDSRKTPIVYLTIIAAAKRFAILNPDVCEFGDILPETTHQKKVRLSVNAPLNTSDIRLLPSTHQEITWNMIPDSGTDTFLIAVQLDPLNEKGLFSSLVTVAFPNGRTLTLPVTAKVVSPVTAQPQTLFYGTGVPGTQRSLEFTLSAKMPFEVLKVVVPADLAVNDLSGPNKQNQKRLKVVWTVPNSSVPLRDKIQILTTVDPLPLHIPVYGFVQKD